MLKFLEALDNCEDVQNVFGNFNLDQKTSSLIEDFRYRSRFKKNRLG